MTNINFYEVAGLVLGSAGVLGSFFLYAVRRQDAWIVTQIKEHIVVHNNDEKAHLAAIKVVGEIILKHNEDPKAHNSSILLSEFNELQIMLSGTLANINSKLENITIETQELKKAHDKAIESGLCFYQAVAKANQPLKRRRTDPDNKDFTYLRTDNTEKDSTEG